MQLDKPLSSSPGGDPDLRGEDVKSNKVITAKLFSYVRRAHCYACPWHHTCYINGCLL